MSQFSQQPQPQTQTPQERLMGYVMLVLSAGILGIAMVGGAKIVYDFLSPDDTGTGLFAAVIVLGITYLLGWLAGIVGIRVFNNPILPILINLFMVIILIGLCILYLEIMQRLYLQAYDFWKFGKYSVVMIAGLLALIGLHFIIEDHDLRLFAIPLLLLCVVHLGVIVYRYVFVGAKSSYFIIADLTFLLGMSIFSVLMMLHVGVLNPLRARSSDYFDGKTTPIRRDE